MRSSFKEGSARTAGAVPPAPIGIQGRPSNGLVDARLVRACSSPADYAECPRLQRVRNDEGIAKCCKRLEASWTLQSIARRRRLPPRNRECGTQDRPRKETPDRFAKSTSDARLSQRAPTALHERRSFCTRLATLDLRDDAEKRLIQHVLCIASAGPLQASRAKVSRPEAAAGPRCTATVNRQHSGGHIQGVPGSQAKARAARVGARTRMCPCTRKPPHGSCFGWLAKVEALSLRRRWDTKLLVLYDPMALWNNAHLLMFRLESKKLRGFHRQRRLTKRLQHFALPAAREP